MCVRPRTRHVGTGEGLKNSGRHLADAAGGGVVQIQAGGALREALAPVLPPPLLQRPVAPRPPPQAPARGACPGTPVAASATAIRSSAAGLIASTAESVGRMAGARNYAVKVIKIGGNDDAAGEQYAKCNAIC